MKSHPLGKFQPQLPAYNPLERFMIELVFKSFLKKGAISIDYGDGNLVRIGDVDGSDIILIPPKPIDLLKAFVFPGLAPGETYMDGKWFIRGRALSDFLKLMRTQPKSLSIGIFYHLSQLRGLAFYLAQNLFVGLKRKKCKHHYNISTNFFRQMLGVSMTYSCAFFSRSISTLEEAQKQKIQTTINRLDCPQDGNITVLEIGCGWGTLSRQVSENFPKANITAITVSEEQYRYCSEYNSKYNNISYKCISYNNIVQDFSGSVDRIVSVGMLEHVGLGMLDDFFNSVKKMLKKDGRAVIHSIIGGRRRSANAWIDKYIFPGGYIPTMEEVLGSLQRQNLSVVEIFMHDGSNYIKTLECWRDNFYFSIKEGKLESEEPRFMRMIDFYLASSVTTFDRDINGDKIVQFVIEPAAWSN